MLRACIIQADLSSGDHIIIIILYKYRLSSIRIGLISRVGRSDKRFSTKKYKDSKRVQKQMANEV